MTGIALCGAAVLVAPWAREHAAAGRSRLRLVTVAVCAVVVVFGATMVARSALADKYRSNAHDKPLAPPGPPRHKPASSRQQPGHPCPVQGIYPPQSVHGVKAGVGGEDRLDVVLDAGGHMQAIVGS